MTLSSVSKSECSVTIEDGGTGPLKTERWRSNRISYNGTKALRRPPDNDTNNIHFRPGLLQIPKTHDGPGNANLRHPHAGIDIRKIILFPSTIPRPSRNSNLHHNLLDSFHRRIKQHMQTPMPRTLNSNKGNRK